MLLLAVMTALLLGQATESAGVKVESLQAQALREVSNCINSGGAEHYAPVNGVVSAPPSDVSIPPSSKITFWRIVTTEGSLFAYSGYEGRTNFCGVVASGVDTQELDDELAKFLTAYEGLDFSAATAIQLDE